MMAASKNAVWLPFKYMFAARTICNYKIIQWAYRSVSPKNTLLHIEKNDTEYNIPKTTQTQESCTGLANLVIFVWIM